MWSPLRLYITNSLVNFVDIQTASTHWWWQRVEYYLLVVVSELLSPVSNHADKDPGSDGVRLWDARALEECAYPAQNIAERGHPSCLVWADIHGETEQALCYGTILGYLIVWTRDSQGKVSQLHVIDRVWWIYPIGWLCGDKCGANRKRSGDYVSNAGLGWW